MNQVQLKKGEKKKKKVRCGISLLKERYSPAACTHEYIALASPGLLPDPLSDAVTLDYILQRNILY